MRDVLGRDREGCRAVLGLGGPPWGHGGVGGDFGVGDEGLGVCRGLGGVLRGNGDDGGEDAGGEVGGVEEDLRLGEVAEDLDGVAVAGVLLYGVDVAC